MRILKKKMNSFLSLSPQEAVIHFINKLAELGKFNPQLLYRGSCDRTIKQAIQEKIKESAPDQNQFYRKFFNRSMTPGPVVLSYPDPDDSPREEEKIFLDGHEFVKEEGVFIDYPGKKKKGASKTDDIYLDSLFWGDSPSEHTRRAFKHIRSDIINLIKRFAKTHNIATITLLNAAYDPVCETALEELNQSIMIALKTREKLGTYGREGFRVKGVGDPERLGSLRQSRPTPGSDQKTIPDEVLYSTSFETLLVQKRDINFELFKQLYPIFNKEEYEEYGREIFKTTLEQLKDKTLIEAFDELYKLRKVHHKAEDYEALQIICFFLKVILAYYRKNAYAPTLPQPGKRTKEVFTNPFKDKHSKISSEQEAAKSIVYHTNGAGERVAFLKYNNDRGLLQLYVKKKSLLSPDQAKELDEIYSKLSTPIDFASAKGIVDQVLLATMPMDWKDASFPLDWKDASFPIKDISTILAKFEPKDRQKWIFSFQNHFIDPLSLSIMEFMIGDSESIAWKCAKEVYTEKKWMDIRYDGDTITVNILRAKHSCISKQLDEAIEEFAKYNEVNKVIYTDIKSNTEFIYKQFEKTDIIPDMKNIFFSLDKSLFIVKPRFDTDKLRVFILDSLLSCKRRIIVPPGSGLPEVHSFCFSPDGNHIAISMEENATVRILRASDGQLLKIVNVHSEKIIQKMHFNHTGDLLCVWYPNTVHVIHADHKIKQHKFESIGLGVRPHHDEISIADSKNISIIDVKKEIPITTTKLAFEHHSKYVTDVGVSIVFKDICWSPDGRNIASTFIIGNSIICYIFDYNIKKKVKTIELEISKQENYMDVMFISDRTIAICKYWSSFSEDPDKKWIHIYDLAFEHPIKIFSIPSNCRHSTKIRFSPDGNLLLSAGNLIQIWRVSDQKLLHTFPESQSINAIFSPDGKLILTASADDGVCLDRLRDYVPQVKRDYVPQVKRKRSQQFEDDKPPAKYYRSPDQ